MSDAYRWNPDTERMEDNAGNPPPPIDADTFLASMVSFLIEGGETEAAALLVDCDAVARAEGATTGFDGRPTRELVIEVAGPRRAYDALTEFNGEIVEQVDSAAYAVRPSGVARVSIVPKVSARNQWGEQWGEGRRWRDAAREQLGAVPPHDEGVRAAFEAIDAPHITESWVKALGRVEAQPEGAVLLARTLLDSTLKTVLDDRQIEYSEGADLPSLWKLVRDALDLAPTQYTEKQFRAILQSCTTIVKELGSVRSKDSEAHGKGRKNYKPAPRHAAFSVNLAGAMAQFIIATHEDRLRQQPEH